ILSKHSDDSVQEVKSHYIKMGAKVIEVNYGKRNVACSIVQLKGYPVLILSWHYLSGLNYRIGAYERLAEILDSFWRKR
ncbi:MAG: hypothetical protein Q9M21_07930, partial [Mariprofundaceae bacterium]|nr:hypothetical protein [Mariprofundaceae bacterium]